MLSELDRMRIGGAWKNWLLRVSRTWRHDRLGDLESRKPPRLGGLDRTPRLRADVAHALPGDMEPQTMILRFRQRGWRAGGEPLARSWWVCVRCGKAGQIK